MSDDIPSACPKCGCTDAYTRERVYGSVLIEYKLDAKEPYDCGDMYDGLTFKGGKWLYCSNCNAKIGEAMPWVKEAFANEDKRRWR